MRNPEGGFAAGASAVLVLLAVLLVAAVVSLYLAWVTARSYRTIGPVARVAGIGPSVVLVGALVWLLGFLRY
ncbi:MAG: hypothetical protein L0Z51_09625 [Candidatus Latescibacteria bacterium]|nr:hypothetical protein [Candidatus Latescibacterota bacterium]